MSDLSFRNNVPDPVLSWKELPTFKFELEKSTGKVMGKSLARKRLSNNFPLRRALHWHDCRAYLDDEPGNYCIAERDAIDLPLFQLTEETSSSWRLVAYVVSSITDITLSL
jgi:hypothetical protein